MALAAAVACKRRSREFVVREQKKTCRDSMKKKWKMCRVRSHDEYRFFSVGSRASQYLIIRFTKLYYLHGLGHHLPQTRQSSTTLLQHHIQRPQVPGRVFFLCRRRGGGPD